MKRFRPPESRKLEDPELEAMRREHAEKIGELQKLAENIPTVIEDVSLGDGVATHIAHKLGRRPKFVSVSPARGTTAAGTVNEIQGSHDLTKVIVLQTNGYGATVVVDVQVS